ncbi:MAG TPA: PQQ-binding-like beta-propeller repeat protein [Fimbriimonadaceae bacterium]|nr:PQQ-binding-like beta-propeller repeat protein [Fimbriimonadaceae bacterium]
MLAALLSLPSAYGQAFQNAGFEAPVLPQNHWIEGSIDGATWSFAGTAGMANGNGAWGYNAHSGQQYAFIQNYGNNGTVTQTVSGFTVGKAYVVTFWMTRRGQNNGGVGILPIEVTLNGSTVIFPYTSPPGDFSWHSYRSLPFIATSDTNTFQWSGLSNGQDRGSNIDDVSIEVASTWPMDRVDRWGGGKALYGPDPAALVTPWVVAKTSAGIPVSHAPALNGTGQGFYGEWNTGNLVEFDAETGAILNTFGAGSTIQSEPAFDTQGKLYFEAAPNLFALDPDTLTSPWHYDTGATFQDNYDAASPVIGPDDDVVFPSTTGTVVRLDHSTGAVVWQQPLLVSDHSVAFSRDDSSVFVANGSSVTCLKYSDGTVLWSFDFGSTTGTPAVAPNGSVVFGTANGLIFDVDPVSGGTNWVDIANDAVTASPAFDGQNVYVGSRDGNLYAYTQSSGGLVWVFPTTGPIDTAPIVGTDGSVYSFNRVGNLYRIVNGAQVWRELLPGGATGSIAIGADGNLYVPNGLAGGLYIIRQQALPPFLFDSAHIDYGATVAGSFADTQSSDNTYWILKNGITPLASIPPIRVALTGTMPVTNLASFSFRVEASASYTTLDQITEALNVGTGSWERLDTRAATTTDSSVLITVNSNPNRFIDPSTGKIQIRVGWHPRTTLPTASWLAKIDWIRLEGIVPAFTP